MNTVMKAILMKPKLNEAFKVVQPLPVLTTNPPVDIHYAAAPKFDVTWRAIESMRNPSLATALEAGEKVAVERSRRRLSAVAAVAGVVQSCVAMADLPPHGHVSPALEVRLSA